MVVNGFHIITINLFIKNELGRIIYSLKYPAFRHPNVVVFAFNGIV